MTRISDCRSLAAMQRSPFSRVALGLFCAVSLSAVPLVLASAQTGSLTTLYSFTDKTDGGTPVGGVVADAAGSLYGETSIGGAVHCTSKSPNSRFGCGTVYSFSITNGLKVLASFAGPNGAHGNNTLTLVGSTLYGTATYGGASDDGVIFSLHTDGTGFTLLHQFNGADGMAPAGILRVGPGKVLYGITSAGGTYNFGVLFSLKQDGTYTILHTFTGGSDGRNPQTLLISASGSLVGSTVFGGKGYALCLYGCGTVFAYLPSTEKYRSVYRFDGAAGTGGYIGSLGPGPTVYGNDGYAPFALNIGGGLANISFFASIDSTGNVDSGPLVTPNGSLVGVNGDGPPFYIGVLYSAANGVITPLANFGNNGTNPLAQPILLPSGILIGTASQNGLCASCGTIWQYTP